MAATIRSHGAGHGYTVRIGGGLLDFGDKTLAAAYRTARNDRRVRTGHLPMMTGH